MIRAAILAALLTGCATLEAERSCYVGVSLIPPSPVFICGLDVGRAPPPKEIDE